ncbi:UNKNOWN [Stylonychia lemnae]|uniref:Uncharacterized protein n=1 Tax=Stylonychia lemnae TaxID=5949 RepID=A0A078B222_STYLE|nr:UNKNOWN [Stylonychia lemnae]|eukprot:CDW87413.1 UNKNOWN [Stylonychia lemnae]
MNTQQYERNQHNPTVISLNTHTSLASKRRSDRPSTASIGTTHKTQTIQLNSKPKDNKFDFVCTSEACFRIKKKLNSNAFGKNTKSGSIPQQSDIPQGSFHNGESDIGQIVNQRKQVSPNMMLKKTKTQKELKLEKKIKELFDNDPIEIIRQAKESPQKRNFMTLSNTNTSLNLSTISKQDKMKQALGSFMYKNIQKEAKNASAEQIKILSDFNIPLHKYNKLATDDERNHFLLENMSNYMKNLLKSLNDLQHAKQMNDYQRINEINKRFQNDQGLYAWLQVCTPHTSLHKKLRKALIEKFQSEDIDPYKKENKMPLGFIGETSAQTQQVLIDSTLALRSGAALQSYIEHTFDDFVTSCKNEIDIERTTNQKRLSFWQYNKTTADTIKLINAKNVDKLKPMHSQNGSKKKKRPQTASAQNLASEQLLGDSENQDQNNQNNNQSKSQSRNQFLSPELKKYLLKKQKQTKRNQLNWNDLYETKFGEHKTEMRIRLADLSSTNSWNQVVLGSFIKLFTKKPKVQEPNLIEEYKNLEYDKVKRIVSSIPSLNECIDKDYFQQIIDKMNKKKIDQVETHISNQVIVNYEKEKEKSKVARFKYLKKKADTKGTIIRKHDDMLNKERQSLQRRDENIKRPRKQLCLTQNY